MDVAELRKVRQSLNRFVRKFDGCIKTKASRSHLRTYVSGQLGSLERKSIEVDGDFYLPQSWAGDEDRRREAGIPDAVKFKPKWLIALELVQRSCAEGVLLRWITADEVYSLHNPGPPL